MIYIDRSVVDEPNVLSKKNSKGRKETVKAIIYFRNPTNIASGIAFPFKAYKEKEVRIALNKLFNGKCGYCESRLVAVTVADIEHFRPKGGFGDSPKTLTKPGYYWLAAKWDNLLASCPNCNRTNKFDIVNLGELTVGKLNKFPISNESFRLRNPLDDFEREESVRCLLDPCRDNPSQHIFFSDDGLILPKKRGNGYSTKGKQSIDVYALQRKELVEEREALAIKIKAQIKSVEYSIKMQDHFGVGNNVDVDEALKKEMETLKTFLNPREPFLSMARQLIDPFINSFI